jgi:hypothetical protein
VKAALTLNYDRALKTELSAQIMVLGMAEGWFTGKQFASYLPATGPATTVQFALARHIINGLDRVAKVAGYTISFQAALIAGGWV